MPSAHNRRLAGQRASRFDKAVGGMRGRRRLISSNRMMPKAWGD
jgi:hypothetical protein